MVVYFDANATEGMDSQYDAMKLINTDLNVPNLYSVDTVDFSSLSINGLPPLPDTLYQVPLGLKIYRDGTIIFGLQNADPKTASKGITLYDATTGIQQNLLSGNRYMVALTQGSYQNRFYLDFGSSTTGLPKHEIGSPFRVYSSRGMLIVDVAELPGNDANLTVYNLIGQPLLKEKIYEPGHYEYNTGLKDGLYIVSIYSGNDRFSVKLFIKGE